MRFEYFLLRRLEGRSRTAPHPGGRGRGEGEHGTPII